MNSTGHMGEVAAAITMLKARIEIRDAQTLSWRKLSEKAGLSHGALSALLKGKDGKISTLQKLADLDGLTLAQLLELGKGATDKPG